jgi:hypothetical protein
MNSSLGDVVSTGFDIRHPFEAAGYPNWRRWRGRSCDGEGASLRPVRFGSSPAQRLLRTVPSVSIRDTLAGRAEKTPRSHGMEAAMPTDEEFLSYNREVIAGFRANAGVVTQPDFPILLITTTPVDYHHGRPHRPVHDDPGRVRCRREPGLRGRLEGRGAVASGRFHDLRANPEVTVELGAGTYVTRTVPVQGGERDRLYRLLAARVPALAAYEQHTSRVFPVVVLEGVPAPDRLGLP